MNPDLGALDRLRTLSEAMLKAARSSDWESLLEHEAQRRTLVQTLRADLAGSLTSAADQEQARTLIEACQRCDARVGTLVARRQAELCVVLRQPATGMNHEPAPASGRPPPPATWRRPTAG